MEFYMEYLSPELMKASTDLATQIGQKSTTAMWDKIRVIKQKGG